MGGCPAHRGPTHAHGPEPDGAVSTGRGSAATFHRIPDGPIASGGHSRAAWGSGRPTSVASRWSSAKSCCRPLMPPRRNWDSGAVAPPWSSCCGRCWTPRRGTTTAPIPRRRPRAPNRQTTGTPTAGPSCSFKVTSSRCETRIHSHLIQKRMMDSASPRVAGGAVPPLAFSCPDSCGSRPVRCSAA